MSFSNNRSKKGIMSVIEKTEKIENKTLKAIFCAANFQ
jgi:hypothetical protein